MGCISTIGINSFPKQAVENIGKTVEVCFHYNTKETIIGVIIRDDIEKPGRMIIQLSDGRHVLSTECQYSFSPS